MDPRKTIGNFFEQKITRMLDLERTPGYVPDLTSRDGSYYIEVKASAFDNGGVINRRQLYTFDRLSVKRFYAFAYHPISKRVNIESTYLTEEDLRKALMLKSVFIFPFSIIKAYFERMPKKSHPQHDDFVQLEEKRALAIFSKEAEIWERLFLPSITYKATQPHERVHLLTKNGNLEQEILKAFHPEHV